jgi:hypothetical protein
MVLFPCLYIRRARSAQTILGRLEENLKKVREDLAGIRSRKESYCIRDEKEAELITYSRRLIEEMQFQRDRYERAMFRLGKRYSIAIKISL